MQYQKFIELVQSCIQERLGEEYVIKVTHVTKNNGLELDGIVIMEKGKNIAPTIYINSYYEDYEKGRSVEDIAETVLDIYRNQSVDVEEYLYDVMRFDEICDKIYIKMINYEMNKSLLERVPHRIFLDMAIVYYIRFEKYEDMNMTAMVYSNFLKEWEISEDELYETAYNNTRKDFKFNIIPMMDMIKELSDICADNPGFERALEEISESDNDRMYILTNSEKNLGACGILYEDVLREFAITIDNDLYILPSSIHEVILLPKNEEYDISELKNMVQEINRNEVIHSEVLSDNIYEYIYSENKIVLH